VSVRADAEGDDTLRIVDPNTGELLDRVRLEARAINAVTLAYDDGLFSNDSDSSAPWVALAGEWLKLVVQLRDATNGVLVDESLRIETDANARPKQSSWDTLEISPAKAGQLPVTVTAGDGTPRQLPVEVVDQIDGVVLTTPNPETTLEIGKSASLLCFRGTNGNRRVAAMRFEFTASSGIETSGGGSCVGLRGTQLGPATLTASAQGFQKTVQLRVVPATQSSRSLLVAGSDAGKSAAPAPRPGERAALLSR
jgi:hypothetical protein